MKPTSTPSQPTSATSLGAALRDLRVHRGISARALSEQAGLSPAYISRLESGSLEPSAKALGSIVRALRLGPLEAAMCLQMCVGSHDGTEGEDRR